MRVRVRSQPDFWSGLLFIGFGTAFFAIATRYRLGTPSDMGPAYFPLLLSGLLVGLGAVISFKSLGPAAVAERLEPISLRPFLLILGSISLFAILLQPLGLVLSSCLLVGLSAAGSHEFGWRYTLVTAAVLAAASCLVFVYGLGLPIPVWPWRA